MGEIENTIEEIMKYEYIYDFIKNTFDIYYKEMEFDDIDKNVDRIMFNIEKVFQELITDDIIPQDILNIKYNQINRLLNKLKEVDTIVTFMLTQTILGMIKIVIKEAEIREHFEIAANFYNFRYKNNKQLNGDN